MGLNKKSVNHASLSELGRYPLHYDIVKRLLKYCYRLENLTTEFPLLKDAFLCSKNLHFTHSASWYSSVNKLLKRFNIQDNSIWYNKSKFGFILRKCRNQKYVSDWKDTSESLKDGKLTTYLFLKTKFKLEKYLTLVKKYEYRKSICKLRTSAHRLLIDTPINPEMKEYVKIVQIKKLNMKLTFSLDVQNLVGRAMIFSIPYQIKLKILPIYLIKINYFGC